VIKGLENLRLEEEARVITLTSDSLKDENSFIAPNKISPQYTNISGVDKNFVYVFPRYSLTVLRLKKR
jgi:alpha-L-arabinofuranosidase